jgi:hypothetical protein
MQLADARVSERPLFSERDRWFESAFLQRRVTAKKKLHDNVLGIALTNKLARIAWAVLNKERAFECVKTREGVRTCMSVAPCSEPQGQVLQVAA